MKLRLCILVAVLLLLTQPAHADTVDHTHSSSRYDRPAATLAHEFARFARTNTTVVTWTEVNAPARANALRHRAAWRTTFAADVAVSWRRHVWTLRARFSARLTAARYRSAGKLVAAQRALFVVLDRGSTRLLVTVAHLPAHVEYGDRFRRLPARVNVWRRSVAGWAALTRQAAHRYRPDIVVATGDVNVNVRRPVWRQRLEHPFRPYRLTWRRGALPAAGTHAGRRLIDVTLSNATGRARLLPDDSSSDHRPYRERLMFASRPGT